MLYRRRGTLISSGSRSDVVIVPCCAQMYLLTRAMASAKVGLVLAYHAVARGTTPPCRSIRTSAARVTTLNSPAKAGGGARDGLIGPLALGLHTQVSPQFLKGHLDLPAQHIPPQYPQRFRLGIGAKQCARFETLPEVFDHKPNAMGTRGLPPTYQTATPDANCTMVALPSDPVARQVVQWVGGGRPEPPPDWADGLRRPWAAPSDLAVAPVLAGRGMRPFAVW